MIYNWQQKVKEIQGLENHVNFTQAEFTKSIVKDLSILYKKHYNDMLTAETPLSVFVNKQSMLLEV